MNRAEMEQEWERLADIGDLVLAGTPIEKFNLGSLEVHFVVGYTKNAIDELFTEFEKDE